MGMAGRNSFVRSGVTSGWVSLSRMVSMKPGETSLTVMPYWPSPEARDLVRVRRPPLPTEWGSAEDLFAGLGGTANRYPDGTYREVARHVRSRSLLAAKAHGRLALDSVYLDIKNLDGLRAEVDDAVAVGFDAKVAIHPTQVPVIRAGYAPSADQVQWARHVLAAAADERGVFAFEGIMVDAPVLRRAER